MQVTTTRRSGPKSWAWSYSKLKNFETCPKRHYHVDLAKDFKEDESEQLQYGNELHAALANRISKGHQLPRIFEKFEPWAQKVLGGSAPHGVADYRILVEQKFAIDENKGPCSYFDNSAWYRGVGDVVKIVGPVALAIDWKTGKIVEDGVQLALMAGCVFAHFPTVQKIRTEFVWLKEDATTRADFTRADMVGVWNQVHPRVAAMKQAHDTQMYPPKPGNLCRRWCPVSACPHHSVG